MEKDVKSLTDNTGLGGVVEELQDELGGVEHVMLSYEWGCQQSVLLIKSELQKAGEAQLPVLAIVSHKEDCTVLCP